VKCYIDISVRLWSCIRNVNTQKEGESLRAAWSRYNQLALSGPELSIPDVMFMQHFVHGLGTESDVYLDMTSGGVFVHWTVEEGKLILDRIPWSLRLKIYRSKLHYFLRMSDNHLSEYLRYLNFTSKGRIASTHCIGNRLER
jgi:hypothetical protein